MSSRLFGPAGLRDNPRLASGRPGGLRDRTVLRLKPAVAAIVVEAVIRIGKRVLRNWVMVTLAAAAFIGIFFFELPFPLVVLAAGLIGLVGGWLNTPLFHVIKGHAARHDNDHRRLMRLLRCGSRRRSPGHCSWRSCGWRSGSCRSPCGAVIFGPESIYVTQGTFFSQAAVVTLRPGESRPALHPASRRSTLRTLNQRAPGHG